MRTKAIRESRGSKAATLLALLLAASMVSAQSPIRFGEAQPIDDERYGAAFTLPISVDLDDDGDQDWVYTVGNYFAVRWLENQGGTPALYARHDITSYGSVIPYGRAPAVADLDNDGDLDVVVSGKTAGSSIPSELSWWEQPPDPVNGLWRKRLIFSGSYFGRVFAEHLNSDDRPDIVSVGDAQVLAETPSLRHLLNSAVGTVKFAAPITDIQSISTRPIIRTDLDSDGNPDFLLDSTEDGLGLDRIEFERGEPTVISKTNPMQGSSNGRSHSIGDLNGDRRPDVAYISYLVYLPNPIYGVFARMNRFPDQGFGTERLALRFPAGTPYPIEVTIVDLDGDGRGEIFSWHRGGLICVSPNAGGDNPFTRLIVPDSPSLPDSDAIGLIDFDRDGDLDFAREGARLQWFPNESSAYIRGVRLHQDLDEGIFTPGETGNLLVNLGNFAAHPVADVSIDLSSSSPEFILVISSSNLGTINKGGSRDLLIPFQISAGAVCSTTLDVVLDVKVAGITVDHYVVPVLVGRVAEMETITDVEEAPNVAISDPAIVPPDLDPSPVPLVRTLHASLPVGPIVSILLDLNITHSYRGDLIVQLRSPQDTTRTIFEGTVNDAGTSIMGSFTLTDLNGEQAAGDYDLVVTDRNPGDTGTLVSWGLTVTATTQDCALPAALPAVAESLLAIAEAQPSDDLNEDGIIDAADLVPAD